MDNGKELISALMQIEKEKGIDKELIFEAIESSLVTACKKNYGATQNVKVVINRITGNVQVFAQKDIVEKVTNSINEISLEEAKLLNIKYELGDIAEVVITPRDFGRISAQTAKQVVVQKFREAERQILFEKFREKEHDLMTGIIKRREKRNIIIELDKVDVPLIPSEAIPNEKYSHEQRIKVYVSEVKQTPKGPQIVISRTNPELVKRLFELSVNEVYDGTIEIKSVSREAGSRTKIAVYSKNEQVDSVGTCVGQNGHKVNAVVKELNGEKIDVIAWCEDPKYFIAASLSPSSVISVVVDEEKRAAKVVVPNHQLSLAIGKEGQNVRLAAKLTGWRIDIKSEFTSRETNFIEEHEYYNLDYYNDSNDYDGQLDENYYDEENYDEENYDAESSNQENYSEKSYEE